MRIEPKVRILSEKFSSSAIAANHKVQASKVKKRKCGGSSAALSGFTATAESKTNTELFQEWVSTPKFSLMPLLREVINCQFQLFSTLRRNVNLKRIRWFPAYMI
jgi:hypothetical protein